VDPRESLDICGKSAFNGIQSPDRPARSESLYRLRHPDPLVSVKDNGRNFKRELPVFKYKRQTSFYVHFYKISVNDCNLTKHKIQHNTN
jgi:hypothetical protein